MDFHLPDGHATPSSVEPIKIIITFSESSKAKWNQELVGRLTRAKILQVNEKEENHVNLQVMCEYRQEKNSLALVKMGSKCYETRSTTTISMLFVMLVFILLPMAHSGALF